MKIRFALFLMLILSNEINAQKAVERISKRSNFENLSGLPLTNKYGQASAVKMVYDLKFNRLYFINAKYYKYHYEFCREYLNNEIEAQYFNDINYSNSEKQRFLLANINYFDSSDTYVLEISPVDLMISDRILSLYEIVSKAVFFSSNFHFLINTSRLQKIRTELEPSIPLISPSDIYNDLNYQAISKYENQGILKFVNDLKNEKNDIKPTDIIVINETPLYLPKVAGIIVTKFQTPLSHLTILGQNRKIPISVYKQAFQDSILRSLENKKINYSVGSNSYKVEPIKKIKINKQREKKIKLKSDLETNSLIEIKDFNKKSYKYAGNKAANFGILYKISRKASFKTPESAFVIPFYFYKSHVSASKAQNMIDELLENEDVKYDFNSLKSHLRMIRNEIKNSPVDPVLISSIESKIRNLGDYKRMRFRSSTNAEDAKGFSGAGLYTSKTGILDSINKPIDKAIKKVWASLWSFEAFSERELYNINHHDAYMAILVHRSFPNEDVNGVAITKNLYRPDYYGFVVNAQLGEESVVKPTTGVVSDQFICYPDQLDNVYSDNFTIDIITTSSLNNGKLVMTQEEIQNLANQLEIIKKYFKPHTSTLVEYLNHGLDMEFKLDGPKRDLYIKQVRLYND